MNLIVKILLLLPFLLTAFTFPSAVAPDKESTEVHCEILPESSLYVEGRSNVNRFTCLSRETLGQHAITVFPSNELEGYMSFRDARITLDVRSLDCGMKGITRDFRETVRSDEHPYILIDLLDAMITECAVEGCDTWAIYQVSVQITLAGTCKLVEFPILVQPSGENTVRCEGQVTLGLSDFGLEPPTALAGLIKVKNEIEINVDLYLALTRAAHDTAP